MGCGITNIVFLGLLAGDHFGWWELPGWLIGVMLALGVASWVHVALGRPLRRRGEPSDAQSGEDDLPERDSPSGAGG